MKKIFTLLFATVLFSAAAFAQNRYHNNDNGYTPSYQYQSNGYATNGNHWKDDNTGYMDRSTAFQKRYWDDQRRDGDDRFMNDQRRDWDDNRFMNDRESVIGRSRFYNDNYDRYRARRSRRFSFQIFLGERNRF